MAKCDIKSFRMSDHHPAKHVPNVAELSQNIEIVCRFNGATNKMVDRTGLCIATVADRVNHLLVKKVGEASATPDLNIQPRQRSAFGARRNGRWLLCLSILDAVGRDHLDPAISLYGL